MMFQHLQSDNSLRQISPQIKPKKLFTNKFEIFSPKN